MKAYHLQLMALVVLGSVLGPTVAPTSAQTDWRKMVAANYPARVKAIVGLPVTMDAQNCVTWGRWEVCFAEQLPVASLEFESFLPEGYQRTIVIRPLRCKNPATGEKACAMQLHWADPKSPYSPLTICHIFGPDLPVPSGQFDIRCPSGLLLE